MIGLSLCMVLFSPLPTSALLYRCDICLCNYRFERAYCTDMGLDKIPNLGERAILNLKNMYLTGNKFNVIQPGELSIYKAEKLTVHVRRQIGIVCVWINGSLPNNIELVADCVNEQFTLNPLLSHLSTPTYNSSQLTPKSMNSPTSTRTGFQATSTFQSAPTLMLMTETTNLTALPTLPASSTPQSETKTTISSTEPTKPPQKSSTNTVTSLLQPKHIKRTTTDTVLPSSITTGNEQSSTQPPTPSNSSTIESAQPKSSTNTTPRDCNIPKSDETPIPTESSVPPIIPFTSDVVQQEATLATDEDRNFTLPGEFVHTTAEFSRSMTEYNKHLFILNIAGSVLLLLSFISILTAIIYNCKLKRSRGNRGFNREFYSLSYTEPANSNQSSDSQYLPIQSFSTFRNSDSAETESHLMNILNNENFHE